MRLAGLEPATLGLEGRCSIQLSYRRVAQGATSVALRFIQGVHPWQVLLHGAAGTDKWQQKLLRSRTEHS